MDYRVHYKKLVEGSSDEYDHDTIDITADSSDEAQKKARKKLGTIIIKKTKLIREK